MKTSTPLYAIVVGTSAAALIAVVGACSDGSTPAASSTSSSGGSADAGGSSSSGASGSSSASSSSTSSSSSSSSSSASSSASSSSGTVPVDVKAFAAADCEHDKKCFPNSFAAVFASVDECATLSVPVAPAGVVAPPGITDFDIAACVAKLKTAGCLDVVPECDTKGTLALGTACDFSGQCATGNCVRADLATTCGKCAAKALEGAACTLSDCADGLRCDFAATDPKCVKTLANGADCSGADNQFNCAAGLTCVGAAKKCGAPHDIGQDCTMDTAGSNDCRPGLDCVTGKCADVAPKLSKLGGVCGPGPDDASCLRSSCVATKCVAFAKADEDCSLEQGASKPDCIDTLTCVGGKCKPYGKANDACDDADVTKAACDLGLECKANKCTAFAYCK